MAALLVCPRCLTPGLLQVFDQQRVVYMCRECEAAIDAGDTTESLGFVPHEGSQCVIWRNNNFRCELWTLDGTSVLRVYDGAVLLHSETFGRGTGWAVAAALRLRYTARESHG